MTQEKTLDNETTKFEDAGETMADLLKNNGNTGDIGVGKEIEVKIIAENADGFLADLGVKVEGLISKSDYENETIPPELKVGEKVRVKILDMRGQPKLSRKEVVKKEKWDSLTKIARNGTDVEGTILKSIKGGFIVDLGGVNAFLPLSQLEGRFVRDANKHVGKTYQFAIAEFNRNKEKIVVSRRKILEAQKAAKKKAIFDNLSEGQILEGTISNFARLKNDKNRIFGAFIDLGGVDGLLHTDEMAWHKVIDPEGLFKVGQTIKVQVIKFDKEKEKISLSARALAENPWDSAAEKYPVGLIVKGKVVSTIEYGAFIELEKGIDAFLHNSEYSWNENDRSFKSEVKRGGEIQAQIISADFVNKKIALSVKRTLPNPWDDIYRKYSPGTRVKGIVQNLTPFGAFVKLPEAVEGLIHISDFSWTKKVNHPADMLKKGDEIEVVVSEVNPQKEQISLSIKHLNEDPYKKYKKGTIVKGKVVRISDFGYFIELDPGIEALVKHGEAAVKSETRERGINVFKEGDEVEAKIIKVDAKDRKIEASVKKLDIDREKELVKKYANQDIRPTLGDILASDETEEDEESK